MDTNTIPEINPTGGGSFIRHPQTGELAQVEGPDLVPAAPTPAAAPETAINIDTFNQE